MNVSHDLELIERKGYVYAGTVNKPNKRLLIHLHDKVLQEYLILVRVFIPASPLTVGRDVIELIFLLAGALGVVAFRHVHVDDSNHSSAMCGVMIHSVRIIAHAIDLN